MITTEENYIIFLSVENYEHFNQKRFELKTFLTKVFHQALLTISPLNKKYFIAIPQIKFCYSSLIVLIG